MQYLIYLRTLRENTNNFSYSTEPSKWKHGGRQGDGSICGCEDFIPEALQHIHNLMFLWILGWGHGKEGIEKQITDILWIVSWHS